MPVTVGPHRRVRDTSLCLPDGSRAGDYRPTHACPQHVDPPTGGFRVPAVPRVRIDGCEQEAAARQTGPVRQPQAGFPEEEFPQPVGCGQR